MKYVYLIIGAAVIVGALVFALKYHPTGTVSTDGGTNGEPTASSTGTITLPAKYVDILDWPPALQVVSGPFSCTGAGSETASGGKTTLITVNDRQYCRTVEVEGAAGSVYSNYAYAYAAGNKVNIYTFGTREVQCANYPEPEMSQCQKAEDNFSSDALIDSYIRSLGNSTNTGNGIQGSVLLGPTCPVVRNPPDSQCADKPYQTSLKLITSIGQTVKTFSSDASGNFKVDVGPGQYEIIGASTQTLPRCSSQGTIVVGNGYTTANVYCDTGIR